MVPGVLFLPASGFEENSDVLVYCSWLPIIEDIAVCCDLVITDWASVRFTVKSDSYVVQRISLD